MCFACVHVFFLCVFCVGFYVLCVLSYLFVVVIFVMLKQNSFG